MDTRFTYSNRGVNVLGEDDALGLDDEEVDELLAVVQEALERSLGDGEVLSRPELGSQAFAEGHLSGELRSARNYFTISCVV
jgi:hypothetical protein